MSFRQEVIQLLIKTAAALYNMDPSKLSGETRFNEDLHAKSTDIVRFTTVLEDEYDIEVPFMGFKRNETFAAAADYLSNLTGIE